MRQKTWKVLEYGDVDLDAPTTNLIEYHCVGCGRDAMLPVKGVAMAQTGSGLVFDLGEHAVPIVIQCRGCRRVWGSRSALSQKEED